MGLMSIIGNSGLITKVYMPKYIYPLTRVMSSVVNLVISLIPLIMVSLLTGVHFRKSALLALYFLVCLILFTLGVVLLLSAAMVFFRDVQFLWNVISMIWMYATPLFYPETILPDQFKFVLQINPLYHHHQSGAHLYFGRCFAGPGGLCAVSTDGTGRAADRCAGIQKRPRTSLYCFCKGGGTL